MADSRQVALNPRQLELDKPYLYRSPFITPSSLQPILTDSMRWRLVAAEPVNKLAIRMIIREISALNWEIKPVSAEYDDAARYYTDVFSDFRALATKVIRSICVLPQGGAWEVGWIKPGVFPDEKERGTVSFVKFIDAGTLHPTNPVYYPDKPIVQIDPRSSMRMVAFKEDEIKRFVAFPYDEWDKEWWQESPTMASFMAIEALSRIYIYYLKQLRDTPVAGILDLQDFSEDSVKTWAASFREMLEGIDPIKIPILYEHEKPAQWIPMGRNPNELSIGQQFRQYSEIVLGNYGLVLSDLGLFDEGQTKGGAGVRRKITMQAAISFYAELIKDGVQSLLPWYLKFGYTDPDIEEERSKAQIRAADARTVQTLEWLPVRLRAKQAKEWGLLTVDYNPDELEKEYDKDRQEMLQQAAALQAVGKLGGAAPKPGQLFAGEGKVNNGLEDDAKANASTGSRLFTKQYEELKRNTYNVIEKAANALRFKKHKPQVYGDKLAVAHDQLERVLRKAFQQVGKKLKQSTISELLDAYNAQVEEDKIATPRYEEEYFKANLLDLILKDDTYVDDAESRIDALLERLLQDVDDTDIADQIVLDEIAEIYRVAYEEGLLAAALDIQGNLYNRGVIADQNVYDSFNVVSEEVLEYIKNQAAEMVRHINEGTKFFLRQLLKRGAESGMDSYQITEMIKRELFNLPPDQASQLTESRIRSIVNTELNRADSEGRLKQFRMVGLKLKRWITRLVDVCAICLRNEERGSVPLEFMYEDVFGETLTPPGHPSTCHCSLGMDQKELSGLTSAEYWTGA